MGGARPSHRQAAHHLVLQLDLLRYGKRVVYLDAEIAHRAFQLRVPEKQLHGSEVARFLIYLCRLEKAFATERPALRKGLMTLLEGEVIL